MCAQNDVLSILRQHAVAELDAASSHVVSVRLCTELLDWIIYGEGEQPFGYLEANDRAELRRVFDLAAAAATGDSGIPDSLDPQIRERLKAATAMRY